MLNGTITYVAKELLKMSALKKIIHDFLPRNHADNIFPFFFTFQGTFLWIRSLLWKPP